MNLQQQIYHFIQHNHLPEPSIKVGQPMVFFHTKEEPIPAIVREVQSTNQGICANLTVYLPDFTREVEGIGGTNLNIVNRYYLREEVRARTFLTYPEIVFTKQGFKLDTPEVGDNLTQTHSDMWVPTDLASSPRLYGIQTNQIGKFFDPKFYKFQIYVRKDAYYDLHDQPVEAEEAIFPQSNPLISAVGEAAKGLMGLIRRPQVQVQGQQQQVASSSYYDTFFECYEEFFKQKYQLKHPQKGDNRWDTVEIRAIYKQGTGIGDYQEPLLAGEPLNELGTAQLVGG